MTTTAESITRAAAIPLMLEVAEAKLERIGWTWGTVRIDLDVWREIRRWAQRATPTTDQTGAP